MYLPNRGIQLMPLARKLWAPSYLGLFASILIIQLFLPPSVGLADNADYQRLTAGNGLTPNYPVSDRYFRYFAPEYLRHPPGPGDQRGRLYTGNIAFRLALIIGELKTPDRFDIRWMGFVHMAGYLIDFGLLLYLLRNAPELTKWLGAALAVWIFTDVFYSAYLNSLYLDAMGFLCFLAVTLAMIAMSMEEQSVWPVIFFGFAGVAFAGAKPLDGPVAGVLGMGVALRAVLVTRGMRRNRQATAGCVVLAAGLVVTIATPFSYGYSGLVDVVMMRIAKLPDAATKQLPFLA